MASASEAVAFRLTGLYQRLRGRRPEELAVDPVCHMQVYSPHAAATRRRGDEEVFFCSSRCARKFEADPDSYPLVVEKGAAAAPAAGR